MTLRYRYIDIETDIDKDVQYIDIGIEIYTYIEMIYI